MTILRCYKNVDPGFHVRSVCRWYFDIRCRAVREGTSICVKIQVRNASQGIRRSVTLVFRDIRDIRCSDAR